MHYSYVAMILWVLRDLAEQAFGFLLETLNDWNCELKVTRNIRRVDKDVHRNDGTVRSFRQDAGHVSWSLVQLRMFKVEVGRFGVEGLWVFLRGIHGPFVCASFLPETGNLGLGESG
jgi:hypothetical protein